MILDRIVETKRQEVELLKQQSTAAWIAAADAGPAPRQFEAAIRQPHYSLGLIAEVKKASPSKGLIREAFDPVELAKAYELGGADCLSVLTDSQYFQGNLNNLKAVRAAVGLPILRKDFMIDELQVYEARAAGADAILLIVAILEDEQLIAFQQLAGSLGMAVLVEVHDRHELERALAIKATLIGINNRDLRTFETTLSTTELLAPSIPDNSLLVSESGLSSIGDLVRVQRAGAGAVLIGEHFMRQTNVEDAVRELLTGVGS